MPILNNRIDINKKYPISSSIKLVLLIAVIFGLYLKSCYYKKQDTNIIFKNSKVTEINKAYIDVEFDVINKSGLQKERAIYIIVKAKNGKEIASKITNIYLKNDGKIHGYLVRITKIKNPVKNINDVGFVVVKLYNPSIF